MSARLLATAAAAVVAACLTVAPAAAQTLRVRNNHEMPYHGPLEIAVPGLPDGRYGGQAEVRNGVARIVTGLPAGGVETLAWSGPLAAPVQGFHGPLQTTAAPAGRLDLGWNRGALGTLEFGLVVIPGTAGTPEDAVRDFRPLALSWAWQPDGTLRATAARDGYAVELTAAGDGIRSAFPANADAGWLDVRARLARTAGAGAEQPAYVALVRRATTPGLSAARLRFNGRVFDGAASPDSWDRDFWYTRGVDWLSWKAGPLSLLAVNGFTPGPTAKRRTGAWGEGSHFYVWERTRQAADGALMLISEVSGPNPGQAKSSYMPVTQYAPLLSGDTVELRWRLAVAQSPATTWEESQLRAFAGYRLAQRDSGATPAATVDLGVPHVTFGVSYFPYSTLTENFDYYRTAGLDRETFWAFSPTLWAKWRALVPRMRGDLHIARAMGFEIVRLHHLELLQEMDRAEALAFLDFFTGAARDLGMRIMIDTEGPAEWVALLAGRYRDVLARVEIENEVLIPGIKPQDPERWTALYRATKDSAPDAQAFLTAVGNNGMFERLRQMKVPFDRVGVHAYKHGPQWKEAFSSHMLGVADYASGLGKQVTLGEFNWKELTRLSPEARVPEVGAVFDAVFGPRAIPEVVFFQLQESLSFNGSISGTYTRHYEPLTLDRRPKAETGEYLRIIRHYSAPDAALRALPIAVPEVRLVPGRATEARFAVANGSGRPLTIALQALAFDGVSSRLLTPARVTLRPGETHEGRVELRLTSAPPRPGSYHHFVRADYGASKPAVGWGVASHPGAPTFERAPVLADRVHYPQGADVVTKLDWTRRPLAIAYGETASVLEVEAAYQLANTLQSATGRPVRLSSVADLPDSLRRGGTVLVLGTMATSSLVRDGKTEASVPPKGHGVITLRVPPTREGEEARPAGQWLLIYGADKEGAQAAAMDLILRYWKHAKDATTPLSGMEKGAALGNRVKVTVPDPP